MSEPPPPWMVFPKLGPGIPPTQGAEEAYLDLDWLPFWSALTAEAQAAYLDRWHASPEWREAIALRYGPQGFDVAADARESRIRAEQHASRETPSPFSRWRRRLR